MSSSSNVPLKAIFVAIVIHSLWGANTVAVKYSLLVFPPLSTAFFRFVLGAVFIIVWCLLSRTRVWPERSEWPVHLMISALFAVQIAAMNQGIGMTSGAMGSILISTNPLFAYLFAYFLVADDRIGGLRVIGLLTAFAGTLLTFMDGLEDAAQTSLAGNAIVIFSAILLGLRQALGARAVRNIEPLRVALWQMLIALPVFGMGSMLFETIDWQRLSLGPLLGVAYQGVVVAGLGFTVSYMLMKRYSPAIMFSFNFVAPVSGVALSAVLLHERPGVLMFVGMLLVAMGLILVTRPDPPRLPDRGRSPSE